MKLTTSQAQFINWLKDNEPFLYDVAIERAKLEGETLGEYGDDLGSWFDSIINTVTTAIPKVVSTVAKVAPKVYEYQQQRAQAKVARRRAKAGVPPTPAPIPFSIRRPGYVPIVPTAEDQMRTIKHQAGRAVRNLPPLPTKYYDTMFQESPRDIAQRLTAPTARVVAKETKKGDMATMMLPLGIAALMFMGRR